MALPPWPHGQNVEAARFAAFDDGFRAGLPRRFTAGAPGASISWNSGLRIQIMLERGRNPGGRRDVGEGAGGDAHAVEPVLVEAMAEASSARWVTPSPAALPKCCAAKPDRASCARAACRRGADDADPAEAQRAARPVAAPNLPQEGGDVGSAVSAVYRAHYLGLAP